MLADGRYTTHTLADGQRFAITHIYFSAFGEKIFQDLFLPVVSSIMESVPAIEDVRIYIKAWLWMCVCVCVCVYVYVYVYVYMCVCVYIYGCVWCVCLNHVSVYMCV